MLIGRRLQYSIEEIKKNRKYVEIKKTQTEGYRGTNEQKNKLKNEQTNRREENGTIHFSLLIRNVILESTFHFCFFFS
jgi:hypothetical protein